MESNDEDEADEKKVDDKVNGEVDEDGEEDEDEDENNGNEPRTIGQGEMVNILTYNADTIIDDQPTVLPAQGQETGKQNRQPQPVVPGPHPQTREPRP
jgi:hypothetical protein